VQQRAGSNVLIPPREAAFALLGIINWLYQWYDVRGPIKEEELANDYVDFFFRGLLGPTADKN